ncbi:hypothetical protein PO909_020792 [Leuciscus waleckii]
MLHSRLSLLDESSQARAPRGSGPASLEAAQRLLSWGSQMELADDVEMASALSQHSAASYIGPAHGSEARSAASSACNEDLMLELSGSEELDILSIEAGECEDSPPHSLAFKELLEVVTQAVAKLNIDWPAEKQPSRRSLPFFSDLHTEVSRSWNKPFSSRLSSPSLHIYSSIVGSKDKGYGMMPRVEETLASYLSPDAASSLRALALPSKGEGQGLPPRCPALAFWPLRRRSQYCRIQTTHPLLSLQVSWVCCQGAVPRGSHQLLAPAAAEGEFCLSCPPTKGLGPEAALSAEVLQAERQI